MPGINEYLSVRMPQTKEMPQIEKTKSRKRKRKGTKPLIGIHVKRANIIENPILLLDQYDSQILMQTVKGTFRLEYYSSKNTPLELVDWMMDLIQRNVSDMYSKSSFGWDLKKKRKELTHPTSKYLIVFSVQHPKDPVGFVHFRFDMDYGQEVIYCYELQLETNFRSLGIGSRLMSILLELAQKTKLSKIVLSCFKSNTKAINLYNRIGYVLDATNPNDEDVDYIILSKDVLAS